MNSKIVAHQREVGAFDRWLKENTIRPNLQEVIDYIKSQLAIDEIFTETELREWAAHAGYELVDR